jgi:uncharacterized membrane protein YdbT with pleckstrin-like domain
MTIDPSSLEPGEMLLWHDRPNVDYFSERNFLYGHWIGFLLLITGAILATFEYLRLNHSSDLHALAGFLIAVGAFLASRPLWVQRDLRRTLYALTDRRAIIERRGVLLTNRASVPFSEIRRIDVRDAKFGDIIFQDYVVQTEDGLQNTRGGFYAIADVQSVERLLRKQVERARESHSKAAAHGD